MEPGAPTSRPREILFERSWGKGLLERLRHPVVEKNARKE